MRALSWQTSFCSPIRIFGVGTPVPNPIQSSLPSQQAVHITGRCFSYFITLFQYLTRTFVGAINDLNKKGLAERGAVHPPFLPSSLEGSDASPPVPYTSCLLIWPFLPNFRGFSTTLFLSAVISRLSHCRGFQPQRASPPISLGFILPTSLSLFLFHIPSSGSSLKEKEAGAGI